MDLKRELGRLRWTGNKATLAGFPRKVPINVLDKAKKLHGLGDFDAAVQVLESQPQESLNHDCEALVALGLSRFGVDDHVGALKELDRAAQVVTELTAVIHLNRANVLKTMQKYEDALDAAELARRLWPQHFAPYLALIAVHECRGKPQDREESLVLLRQLKEDGIASRWRDDLRVYLSSDVDYSNLRADEPELIAEILNERDGSR